MIAVTGLGVFSSLGDNLNDFWNNVLVGKSGISKLDGFDDLVVQIGGQIKGFDVRKVGEKIGLSKKEYNRLDRGTFFALSAAHDALCDANLPLVNLGDRCSVILGTGFAGACTFEEQMLNYLREGTPAVSVHTIPAIMGNSSSAALSIRFGIEGACYNLSASCASSGVAIDRACRAIEDKDADIVITGGCEAAVVKTSVVALSNMGALTRDFQDQPEKASRPFDAKRSGFVIGEGACILVLEDYEHAKNRNARIHAKIVGRGIVSDAGHWLQPSDKGAVKAIRKSLGDLDPSKMDKLYINAHGTSTLLNDAMEARVIEGVFGQTPYVSSTKSIIGHLLGAASAIESAVCVMALKESVVPPSMNCENQDVKMDRLIKDKCQYVEGLQYALNNSFGFGGQNSALLFEKEENENS